ncbi:hypothetical protein AB0D10_31360 [Kitasatospora sp. NPDC048545]|uniref:hypothetical protein n=1 Tax=Kitasatospora sp. NPDC048545 TaxID=3157208 RepID=UPI0033D33030
MTHPLVSLPPSAADQASSGGSRQQPFPQWSRRQVVAVLLVVFGGYLLPVVGWLIGAIVWLLVPGWTRASKIAGMLVWPLCTLGLVVTSAAAYWLVLPLGDPVSSVITSLFLLVPSSWFLVLVVAAWSLLKAGTDRAHGSGR